MKLFFVLSKIMAISYLRTWFNSSYFSKKNIVSKKKEKNIISILKNFWNFSLERTLIIILHRSWYYSLIYVECLRLKCHEYPSGVACHSIHLFLLTMLPIGNYFGKINYSCSPIWIQNVVYCGRCGASDWERNVINIFFVTLYDTCR